MLKPLAVLLLLTSTASAAEWNGKWALHGEGDCSQQTGGYDGLIDLNSKNVGAYEWGAVIDHVSKKQDVYILNLTAPKSDMNGPATKATWHIIVAKDQNSLKLSADGKTWEAYDRCANK